MTDWHEEDDPGRSSQPLDNYARTLDELEPDRVADQALTALLGHVAGLTMGWRIDLLCQRDLEERTDLHDTVRRLTEFAQQGLPVDEWTQPLQAEEALLYVFHVLYGSACFRGEIDIDVIDDTKSRGSYDYLHLALVAAAARCRLLELEFVTPRGLSALASTVDESWSDEEDRAYIPAEEAIAWLTEHGVPGFS